MDTFNDAAEQLTSAQAGGFKLRSGQVSTLINEGIKCLAEESEWIRAEIEIGETVAGQVLYTVPDHVVRMKSLIIGGLRYSLVDYDDILDIEAGTKRLVERAGFGGVFCERFSEDGATKRIGVYPPPEASGLPIIGNAAIYPPVELGGLDVLPFPPRFRRAVVDYAKGIAYEDVDENPAAGANYLARADARAGQLRALGKSRTRGPGPFKIPVAGHL